MSKLIGKKGFWLLEEPRESGIVGLMYRDWYILRINSDGQIERYSAILKDSETELFDLDKNGCVRVAKQVS